MKPGSPQARALFVKKETEFKTELKKSKEIVKNTLELATEEDPYTPYRLIAVANEYLAMVSLYIQITEDMEFLKGTKNETYLNEGRKTFYNALLNLEKVFTDFISIEPTEIQETVELLPKFDPARKIIFFRKMGFILDRLEGAFGEKTKYRWAFIDMFARFAIIFKNSMDYKQLGTRDPRKPFFEENEVLINILVDILTRASDKLREKYELATREFDDMNKAIKILDEVRRINTILGDQKVAEDVKKKIEVWTDKLEKDMKAKDKKGRRK